MRKYLGFGFKIVILAFKNNFCWQFINEDENCLITKRIVGMFIKKTILKPFKIWQRLKENLVQNFQYLDKINLKKLSNEELILEYLNFMKNFVEEWTIPLVMEGTGIYTEKTIFPEFKKELSKLNRQTISEYFTVLTQPEKLSFISRERLSFLGLCLLVQANKKKLKLLNEKVKISKIKILSPFFYNKLLFHQKNFYWVKTNYFNTEPTLISKFFALLKEEIKNKTEKEIQEECQSLKDYTKDILKRKKEILRKIKISFQLRKKIEALSFFSLCFDERKEMALRGSYYAVKLLKELASRVGMNYLILDYALPGEMAKIISEGREKWFKILTQRQRKFVFVYRHKAKPQIYVGKATEDLWKILFEEEKTKVKMIEGITASRGGENYVEGKVRIVLDPFKDPFQRGEVLVTTMTRPDFLLLVQKAKAVVTDEGGMTCHAAIICRELNVPCIVGTRKATKVLENGDQIVLRLNHGRVEKIDL